MSWTPAATPDSNREPAGAVDLVIEGHPRDLGGFSVRRVLPSPACGLVGPFIFFDQMGPASFAPGQGIDVRPHPHINLATVSYLFEGEILHRDSLGSEVAIRPGDVNWMTAGRGIAHSERSGAERRRSGGPLYGIQCWVALPKADEECEPSFVHYPAKAIPNVDVAGARVRVIVGRAYGAESPVAVKSATLYVEAFVPAGGELEVPPDYAERGVYVVEGEVGVGASSFGAARLAVIKPGRQAVLRSPRGAHVMILGGAPLDGERHLWWNFVSSSRERIERAKADWNAGRFAIVPGDEHEFIPLPES